MAKTTVKELKKMAEELLSLAPLAERYEELKKAVRDGLVEVKYKELEVKGRGRVFISQSERMTVSPELAADILGPELAEKVTVIKKSVPNGILGAFFSTGQISEAKWQELNAQAAKTPVINLHIRPLK